MGVRKSRRIASFIIDMVGANLIFYVLDVVFPTYRIGSFLLFGHSVDLDFKLALLAIPIYFLIFDLVNQGQSLGKIILATKTIDSSSSAAPAGATRIMRTLLKMLSIALWPIALLVYLMCSVTLHDKVARTVTVRV